MKTKIAAVALAVASTLASLGSPSRAFAQAAAAPDPEAPVVSRQPAPEEATASEPNVDRSFLLPTAMTQPAGSITYNNYELLLHGITYGITDRVQASLTVLSPITDDIPFVGFASVKGQVVSAGRVHLALQGLLAYGHSFKGTSGEFDDGRSAYGLGAGTFASLCLREDCSSVVSGSATYQLSMAEGTDEKVHTIVYGGSLVHRVSSHIKLLGEITSVAAGSTNDDMDNLPGFLGSYGVRFYTENIAGDVGFVKPFLDDSGDDFLMGLPFVSLSYRWQ